MKKWVKVERGGDIVGDPRASALVVDRFAPTGRDLRDCGIESVACRPGYLVWGHVSHRRHSLPFPAGGRREQIDFAVLPLVAVASAAARLGQHGFRVYQSRQLTS